MTQETQVTEQLAPAASWGRRLWRIGLLLILIDILAGSFVVGLQMRSWMWEYTKPSRFRYDVGRNYLFGRQAVEQGYLNVYENQVKFPPDEAHKMNYPPLRFGTFGVWAWWNQKHFANYDTWQEDHSFNAFVMYFNTTLEFLAAVAALLLVRHWIWRTGPPIPRPTVWDQVFRGSFRYTLAFLLVWLNIAMIVSAHGWPSWDMWVVPFFLWTVLLCCWEYWFWAGLCLGVGVMFKGQQLSVLTIFILWPIFAGQPGRGLRFLSGFVLAFALIVSGWMLSYRPEVTFEKHERVFDWPAFWWVAVCAAAVVVANGWRLASFVVATRAANWAKWLRVLWAPVMLLCIYVIARPAIGRGDVWANVTIGLAVAMVVCAWAMPLRSQGYVLAGAIGTALLLCMVFFHGGTDWWELGFKYGTERHMGMVIGPGSNLCAILESRFGWHSPLMNALTIPAGTVFSWPAADRPVSVRELMVSIYGFFLILSTIAIAIQWRRNDRNFLIAIVVPWFLFYAIPAQIHERYLLFGSTAAAIYVGCNYGLSVLNVFMILLTALQTVNCMMLQGGQAYRYEHVFLNPDLASFCDRIRPDVGWGVLAVTAVFFFTAFAPSRWRRPRTLP